MDPSQYQTRYIQRHGGRSCVNVWGKYLRSKTKSRAVARSVFLAPMDTKRATVWRGNTITKLREIWNVIDFELPRDEWIPLQSIYSLIESKLQLKPDNFSPSAPNGDGSELNGFQRYLLTLDKNSSMSALNSFGHSQLTA